MKKCAVCGCERKAKEVGHMVLCSKHFAGVVSPTTLERWRRKGDLWLSRCTVSVSSSGHPSS